VETPTATPPPGTSASALDVALSTATEGADIYYTTDGSIPTTDSTPYSEPINISVTTVIKAIAVKEGMKNSAVLEASYIITDTPPIISTGGISLSQTGTYTFNPATYGYTAAPDALTVTVTNTGDQATGDLIVGLSETIPGSFKLSKNSINSIAANGTDTFTVSPNTGLGAGTYAAIVTVSEDNDIRAGFNISFTVNNVNTPVISIPAISGITAPSAYETPVPVNIDTTQYTGTVTWSPSVSTFFEYNETYTAIITLTPKSGYTLQGVASNFFKVAGATAGNNANSGVIRAVFPKTDFFTSISALEAWVIDQTPNGTPYNIKLNVNDIKGDSSNSESLGSLIRIYNDLNYNLDLSGSTITTIPNNAFQGCSSLIGITIPNSVKSIGEQAFEYCGFTSVTIPNSVTEIGVRAFKNCEDLINVTISNSVTVIKSGTFVTCLSLTSVTIPNSVTDIEGSLWTSGAFEFCFSLASVTFSPTSKVTSIGPLAFAGAVIENITIPNSVTSIGDRAFNGCTSLTSVTFQGTIPSSGFHSDAFGISTTGPEYIGDLRDKYFAANGGGIGTYTRPSGGNTWTKTYALGDTGPGGGKVFYYSAAGFTMTDTNELCHYLEAAPSDMLSGLAWASNGYESTDIPGTETAVGTGRKNTALILATDADAPAAKACKEYDGGDKTDWFLPSGDELSLLSTNRSYVGNMKIDSYWSSLQVNNVGAWYQNFSGVQGSNGDFDYGDYKNRAFLVRAIRAF